MSSFFDDMAGTLAGLFGDTVVYAPRAGGSRDILSVFRESPIEVTGADGQEILIDAPTWRVERHLVPGLARGDEIVVPDGRTFRIETTHITGSPSADAFVVCRLHQVV